MQLVPKDRLDFWAPKVSIPQAVGTIAIIRNLIEVSYRVAVFFVSIPQAVGTIAMRQKFQEYLGRWQRFNTASGRYYCNPSIFVEGSAFFVALFQYRKR